MRIYNGTGTLDFPNIPTITGIFEVVFEDSGETTLFFTPSTFVSQLMALPRTSGKFVGSSTSPKFDIEIKTVYLSKVSMGTKGFRVQSEIFHPVKIIYKKLKSKKLKLERGLTNLIFYGTEIIQFGKNNVRGKTTCFLNGQEIRLIQLPDFKKIIQHLKKYKDVRLTSKLEIEGNHTQISALRKICDDVQNLCSLASGNFVTPIYEDIYIEEKLYETTLLPLKTYPFSKTTSLIDSSLHGSNEFKTFLEVTYHNYVRLNNDLGLYYIIEFFNSSKIETPLEAKYLLTTTAFECLENYFRIWKRFPPIRSNLKSKMIRMFNDFRFNFTLTELNSYRDNRNSIIHSGKFPSSVNGFTATMELRNLIERFLLHILGYANHPYYNVVNQQKELLV